ncbi:MAG: FtsX-like permease family protein [Cytophagales bacterium]|nr:FtsX-like permease family protein [Cytophagales bacterium]
MNNSHNSPPKWIAQTIKLLCKQAFHEEILGDLYEFYDLWISKYGETKARRLYVWHAIKFLRLYALKSLFLKQKTTSLMINHHFRIAWRGLINGRGNSLVNIVGLSLAFASSLLIYLWSYGELNKDRFHEANDRIYGVYSRVIYPGGIQTSINTPAKLPAELKTAIPEIEYATGFAKSFRLSLQGVTAETFQKGDIILKMKGSRASPQFFNIFSFKILQGNKENALLKPEAIAISRRMAEIFFGSAEAAINQSIRYKNERNLNVTLVFEDVGDDSSLQFDYLTNWDAWVDMDEFKPSWRHFGTQTYLKLKTGADPVAAKDKIQDFLKGYISFEENERGELGLQLFSEQYLYGNFENGQPAAGKIKSVRFFLGLATFILMIAIINFVNLMTAQARERAKEVSLRKVVGASRSNLMHQFLLEAMLTSIVSSFIGVLLAALALPLMAEISQTSLRFPLGDWNFILLLVGVVLCSGLLAGAYPALVLSRFRFVALVDRSSTKSSGLGGLRKGLVVFQFSLSLFLTVATLVFNNQLDYLLNKSLGFDREHLIYVPIEGALKSDYRTFREEAVKVPGVLKIDRSSQTPHKMGFSGQFFNWEGKEESDNVVFTPSSVGFDFVETMGIELVEGRDFDRSRPADINNFLINETAARAMGGNVLNKDATIFGKEGKVIGVFKDFHFNSLHSFIQPMVLDVKEGLNFGTITIQLNSDQVNSTLQRLEKLHAELNPGHAFDYSFVKGVYEEEYQSEQLVAALVPFFSGLAIFISCLGLFGLVTFTLQSRVKELGIRKVLGASFSQLVRLISRDFAMLLIVAAILALPLSFFAMQDWLAGYAYSIELDLWVFAAATILSTVIAFAIIFGKVAKSAMSNPVDSLRSE